MSHELLAELSEEELAAPNFYPIEYALMWVAYGNKPINTDYAKIIYDRPPTSTVLDSTLENAEKKLLTYLRCGKISAKTAGYEEREKGEYTRTGKYELLEREAWKGNFDWFDLTLNYCDNKGVWYECTDITVNTKQLLECTPVKKDNLSKKANDNTNEKPKNIHTKEKETLLKMIAGMAVDGYGYDPLASRSPVTKEIADMLAEKGIALDPDTVRKWLKEATELLPSIKLGGSK